MNIEDVRLGDRFAPPPGHSCDDPRCGEVVNLFRNWTDQVVSITAVTRPRAREHRAAARDGGEAGEEDGEPPPASSCQTIRCTPGHPFFVEARGYVVAGDLRAGDEFEARGVPVVVAAVEVRAERAETFNFEVRCHHTYRVSEVVGKPTVLVHNISPAQGRALNRLLSGAINAKEKAGINYAYKRMSALGYYLVNADLSYHGRHGVDMVFYRLDPATGRRVYAVVEAKRPEIIRGLRTYSGLRQASNGYNIDRLKQYLLHGDGRHDHLVNTLLRHARVGRLESFAASSRSKKLLRMPRYWPAAGKPRRM